MIRDEKKTAQLSGLSRKLGLVALSIRRGNREKCRQCENNTLAQPGVGVGGGESPSAWALTSTMTMEIKGQMEQNSGSGPCVLCNMVLNCFNGNSAQVNQHKDIKHMQALSVCLCQPNHMADNVNTGKII